MNPNHYLAVAIQYLYTHRDGWAPDAAIGKTLVSSSMIDRVAASLGRRLLGGAGRLQVVRAGPASTARSASAARRAPARASSQLDGSAWTTDKDGILLALLATEILAVTGKSPSRALRRADRRVRRPGLRPGGCRGDQGAEGATRQAQRRRHHAPTASPATRSPRGSRAAPGNGAAIGGVKVVTEHAWFAARPSGTEDVYKIYAESFRGPGAPGRGAGRGEAIVDAALGA